jgi:hypothetical protein
LSGRWRGIGLLQPHAEAAFIPFDEFHSGLLEGGAQEEQARRGKKLTLLKPLYGTAHQTSPLAKPA